ncbi:MAG: metal-dependent hydrolase [Clostridiaceae bacterium]|nr:metal-dependent hydrolase [Clostridiaceae bacterium]
MYNLKLKNKVENLYEIVEYRVVLVGAILPDIIDKPIGAYLFRSTFHNSRIFAHTLTFSAILIFIGLYRLYKHRKNNILGLGLCASIHIILDSMWLYPGILFWPYYGLKFPQRAEGNWLNSDIIRLITDPSYYLPEIIGFAIIAYYFWLLVKNKEIKSFIRRGKL